MTIGKRYIPLTAVIAIIGIAVLLISVIRTVSLTDVPIRTSREAPRLAQEPSELGYIYYSDGNSLRRVRPDGLGDKAMLDFYSEYCFYNDGWVYYTDNERHPEFPGIYKTCPVLHRMREDGSEDMQVTDIPVKHASFYDGHIYYSPYKDIDIDYGDGVFRVDPDGGSKAQIYFQRADDFYFDDVYIYVEAAGSINRKALEGGGYETIISGSGYSALGITHVDFDEEHIYFIADKDGDYLDNMHLYRAKKDGSELTRLTDKCTEDFVLCGNKIYYIESETTISAEYLYTCQKDGGNKKQVGMRRVHEDCDYLRTDGRYVYVFYVDGYVDDGMTAWERSALFRIKAS